MLKFKTSCAVLANLSSNLLSEVRLSLFRYFEVGLRVCDIVVNKYVRYLISWWVLVYYIWQLKFMICHLLLLVAGRCCLSGKELMNCRLCGSSLLIRVIAKVHFSWTELEYFFEYLFWNMFMLTLQLSNSYRHFCPCWLVCKLKSYWKWQL